MKLNFIKKDKPLDIKQLKMPGEWKFLDGSAEIINEVFQSIKYQTLK